MFYVNEQKNKFPVAENFFFCRLPVFFYFYLVSSTTCENFYGGKKKIISFEIIYKLRVRCVRHFLLLPSLPSKFLFLMGSFELPVKKTEFWFHAKPKKIFFYHRLFRVVFVYRRRKRGIRK